MADPQHLITVVEAILESNSIDDARKESLLKRLEENPDDPALKAELDALFDAELAEAQEELGSLQTLMSQLQGQRAEADAEAAPLFQGNATVFKQEVNGLVTDFVHGATTAVRQLDQEIEGLQRGAEADQADAIRKSLKGE